MQSGFRQDYGITSTLVLWWLMTSRSAADQRKVPILVQLDFTGAFDCVSAHLIIVKMKTIGFSTTVRECFISYYVDCSQMVQWCDNKGKLRKYTAYSEARCDQGSLLGPILFSLPGATCCRQSPTSIITYTQMIPLYCTRTWHQNPMNSY